MGLRTVESILYALRPEATASSFERSRIANQVDWDDLAIQSIILGLAPYLLHRLDAIEADVPDRARAKLALSSAGHAERNKNIFEELTSVLTALAARDVVPVALKGVHLAQAVYPDRGLRPMSDIDLLVDEGELAAVTSALLGVGFVEYESGGPVSPGPVRHTKSFERPNERGKIANPYLATQAQPTVEPHTSLVESRYGLVLDITPHVRRRARPRLAFDGAECDVFDHEDLLLHVTVHAAGAMIAGSPTLVQLIDVALICQEAVDWEEFVRRAREAQAASFCYAALTLAQKTMGARAPAAALDVLRAETSAPLLARIDAFDLAYVLGRTRRPPPSSTFKQLLLGADVRLESAMWANDWTGRMRVLREATRLGRSSLLRRLARRSH